MRSTVPLRLVTERSPAIRSSVMFRFRVGEDDRTDGLIGRKILIRADIHFAIEPRELKVGAAGVKADVLADVLKVGGPKEIAIDID